MRISDWSSDVCSSDLGAAALFHRVLVHVFFGNKGIGTQAEINFIPELLADIGIVPLGIKTAGRIPIMGICSTVVIKTRTWVIRSEEHTSELQSLMRISYAVFCLKNKHIKHKHNTL